MSIFFHVYPEGPRRGGEALRARDNLTGILFSGYRADKAQDGKKG